MNTKLRLAIVVGAPLVALQGAAAGELLNDGDMDGLVPGTNPDCGVDAGAWGWPQSYIDEGLCELLPGQLQIVATDTFQQGATGNSVQMDIEAVDGTVHLTNLTTQVVEEAEGLLVIATWEIWVPTGSGGGGCVYVGGDNGGGGFSNASDRGPQFCWLPTDQIQAYNGDDNPIVLASYPRDTWQTLRVEIDLFNDKYDAFWSAEGAGEVQIGDDLAFRSGELALVDRFSYVHFGGVAPTVGSYLDNVSVTTDQLPPFGACCDPATGDCLPELTREECNAQGGQFNGIGSVCEDVICYQRGARGWIVPAPITWSGDTCNDPPSESNCDFSASEDNQWEINIPWPQAWTFTVCNAADFDTALYLSTSTGCDDNAGSNDDATGCALTSEIIFDITEAPTTVFLTLEGADTLDCGTYTMSVSAPCAVIDPVDCIEESGGACADEDTDPANVGCNAEDPQEPTFDDVSCGETRCGSVGNFTLAGGGRRDLDWYKLELTVPTTVTMTAVGEFPEVVIFMADLDEVGDPCASGSPILASTSTTGCNQIAEYTIDLAPGLYSPIITTEFADPADVPCGGLSEYEFTLTCTSECVPGGDVDGNGCVEFADILVILGNWSGAGDGDADCSGVVEFADILVVLGEWGNGCP